MDPKACLDLLDQNISDGEYIIAVEALNNYYQWRIKGGYEPHHTESGKRGDNFADWCATRLISAMEHPNMIVIGPK